MTGSKQLVFDLGHAPSRAPEDFVVTPANRVAYALVEAWPQWPARAVGLIGPDGAGKSHLAAIWQVRSAAVTTSADSIESLDMLAAGTNVLVEDVDRTGPDERALFHLFNLVTERGLSLLLTSRVPLRTLPIALPDLASRLSAVPTVELLPPDDLLLTAVMAKQFADRQIAVDPGVIAYMVTRMERSLAAASAVVDGLDRLSLAEGRRITKSLAARHLDGIGADE